MMKLRRVLLSVLALVFLTSLISISVPHQKASAAVGEWAYGICYYLDDFAFDSCSVFVVKEVLGANAGYHLRKSPEKWYWCEETDVGSSVYECLGDKEQSTTRYPCGEGSYTKSYTDGWNVKWTCFRNDKGDWYFWVTTQEAAPRCDAQNVGRIWAPGSRGKYYICYYNVNTGTYQWLPIPDPFTAPGATEPSPNHLPQLSPNPGFVILDFQHPEEERPSLLKWSAGSGTGIVTEFKISNEARQWLFSVPASSTSETYSMDIAALSAVLKPLTSANSFTINAYKADGTGYYIGSASAVIDQAVRRAAGEFNPVRDHYRAVDTRTGLGGKSGPVGSEVTDLQIASPTMSSVTDSMVLNITVVDPTAASWLTVWESETAKPTVSNLNYEAGQTVANQVTVRVSSTGKISLSNALGGAHILIDVQGYYSKPSGPYGSRFHPTGPTRVADSRTGLGGLGSVGKCCAEAQVITNDITSQHNGALSGVKAVTLNVTATNVNISPPYTSSFLTIWRHDWPRPEVSHMNFKVGETVSNQITVPVSADGKIRLYSDIGSVSVIVDLVGYYTSPYPGYDGAYGRYISNTPRRVLDTRQQIGIAKYLCPSSTSWGSAYQPAINCNTQYTVNLESIMFSAYHQETFPKYVPLASVFNITATGADSSGFIAMDLKSLDNPTSTLNYVPDKTVAGAATSSVAPCHGICGDGPTYHHHIYNSTGKVHVIADIFGFFVKSVQ